jgi:nucleoid-associated protein YgaU
VASSRAQLNASLKDLQASPDPAKVEDARAAFDDMQGQVEFLKADPQAAPAAEAATAGPLPALPPLPEQALADLQAAEPLLEQLEAGQAAPDGVLAALTPPLEDLSTALESLCQAETMQVEAGFMAAVQEEEAAQASAGQPGPPVVIRPRLGDRLDQLAFEQYGDPAFWRLLAAFNDISDIFHIPSGQALSVPPASLVEGR